MSATLTTIRAETAGSHPHPESLLLNVSGRLLMVQREHCTDNSDVVSQDSYNNSRNIFLNQLCHTE